MNRCVKRVCDCVKPYQVFKCLKLNLITVDLKAGEVELTLYKNKNKNKYIDNGFQARQMFPPKKNLCK